MRSKNRKKGEAKPRSREEQSVAVGGLGAHLQFIPRVHHERRSKNKVAEQRRKACRAGRWD